MQEIFSINSLINNEYFVGSEPYFAIKSSPMSFIDIGSRGGAHSLLYPLAKFADVIGFEPDKDECQKLSHNTNHVWHSEKFLPYALYNAQKNMDLYITNEPNNTSLLKPNTEFVSRYDMEKWKVIKEDSLETTTLDKALQKHNIQHCGEFVKLDTQGTEFEILEGSSYVLKNNCLGLLVEVSFCELYSKQKLFSEIEMLLRRYGFSFYGFTSMHARSKKLLDKRHHIFSERAIYADALFFKDPIALKTSNKRHCYILFILAILNKHFDFALEVANYSWLKDSKQEERDRIYNLVHKLSFAQASDALKSAKKLVKDISANQDMANVIVGSFVDSRRKNCDYNDILNISPLPPNA